MYLKTAKIVRKGLRWESKKGEHDKIERVNDEIERVNDEKGEMMMKNRNGIMKGGDERIGERDTGVEPASQAWEDSRVSR